MDAKLAKIYYSPVGYWKGIDAIKKLSAKPPRSQKMLLKNGS